MKYTIIAGQYNNSERWIELNLYLHFTLDLKKNLGEKKTTLDIRWVNDEAPSKILPYIRNYVHL